jgi:hypothetical protein
MIVQLLMSFVAPPPETVEPVWPTLDPVQRDEIVTALARLIAKAAMSNVVGVVEEEERDE